MTTGVGSYVVPDVVSDSLVANVVETKIIVDEGSSTSETE